VTKIGEFTDLGEYVSHGITWDEFNAEQERLKKAAELREKKLARIREMRRMKAEREAKQVEENEQESVCCCARAAGVYLADGTCLPGSVLGSGTRFGATL